MLRCVAVLVAMFAVVTTACHGQSKVPVHLWYEPEWFDGVKGSFAYWTGTAKPTGAWGVAGPGIAAEWSQGGESEWNSMGACAEETKAECRREFIVPRAGKYTVWVRYVDHRHKTEPFRVTIEQDGRKAIAGELGVNPVVPANDEYQLFWGFSFGWGSLQGELKEGPAKLTLSIDRAGEAWRQLDAVLVTDDATFTPHGREKPAFAFHGSFGLQPANGASWRGDGMKAGASWKRPVVGGKDFSMWSGIEPDVKWWDKQDLAKLTPYDTFFQFGPPADIREKFHKQFAGRRDVPIMAWQHLTPGFYLGNTPDLSEGTALRKWLERTRTPFYIMTNYASGSYTDKTGPATYAALVGPLVGQFMGYIHGEAVGTGGVSIPDAKLANDRRGHVDAMAKKLREQQADSWSKIYKTKVSTDHFAKSISCLSVDSISLAHLFHDAGSKVVGYELDATNVHAPMRIAFERGAARQYGGAWINYASGNFGDSCNYFTQNPTVPRGAPSWFHSRYAITDGVSAAWYRKLYYLNYLGGASAIYWEQSLTNQYLLPGPGAHPIQLSPFGRATEDFQKFVDRLPDRGEPYTPVALLLSHGHGYERVNNACRMLHVFPEDRNDLELRELFNVCWHPSGILEGQPAAPDVQSMPSGVYGDVFDVLVDRPKSAKAMFDYPVVWAAGDANLTPLLPTLEQYLSQGGTLVVNVAVCKDLPEKLLGLKLTGKTQRAEQWQPDDGKVQAATPFQVAEAELKGAKALVWANEKQPLITRHVVGKGAVIVTLMPNLIGLDERAHPSLPYLMNGLTQDLLPVEVRLANGDRLKAEVQHHINKTKDGWLVAVYNHRGIDKTQNGIARVDRRAEIEVVLRTKLPVKSVREFTEAQDVPTQREGEFTTIRVRVPAGDLRVVSLRGTP